MIDNIDKNETKQNLIDAGCNKKVINDVLGSIDDNNLLETNRLLLLQRKKLLNQLHKSQRQIQNLDFLIYCLEKPRKEK